jgi:hypothetical protein
VLASLARVWGVQVTTEPVCIGHHAPIEFLDAWVNDRPDDSLVLGPRGGGKSYLRGFATHLDSMRYAGTGTRILGGSMAQSRQVYNALGRFMDFAPGQFAAFTIERARYRNGSDVETLAASPKSTRGPHVPTLCLDEVDEIDPDLQDTALGMAMEMDGLTASVSRTSTWHRIGGPMAGLLERAEAGQLPFWRFCAFEVLERCPDDRSGPALERCPECPIVRWCHEDRDQHPTGLPKAKRSNGHYSIASLIQKARSVSERVFESDYLCRGPKADGLIFPRFGDRHVTEAAEYDPLLHTYLAVDVGVYTGAVLFQVDWNRAVPTVRVVVDYLSYDTPAEENARALVELVRRHARGRLVEAYCDPAGNAKNPVGPRVIEEYERGGLRLTPWPMAGVLDGLALLEGLIESAAQGVRLTIHPRAAKLKDSLRAYRRAKRQGQWTDRPEDPQHPAEDLVDALRGGLVAVLGLTNSGAEYGGDILATGGR